MTKVSKDFYRNEFACKCGCGWDVVDSELLDVLQDLRTKLDTPIIITSGVRCEAYNKKVGGSPNSQHKLGKAADFTVDGYSAKAIYDYLDTRYPDCYGLGRYPSWVHLDVREQPARW